MKKIVALLLVCFTFSNLAEARGRSRSPVKKKRTSSSIGAPTRSPQAAAQAARVKAKSPPPIKRRDSFIGADQIHSQKVRGNQGVYTPVGDPQKVAYTKNKNMIGQQKTFYRGVKDVNNLPKGDQKSYVDNAFKNGIPSNARIKENVPGVHDPKKPAVTNVWQHQNKSAENSAFVATTSSKKVAAQKYSGPSGGFFEIKPKNSGVIDVNKTVGKTTDKAKLADKEFLFPNEVPSSEIKAFHKVDGRGKVIETTPNPFY